LRDRKSRALRILQMRRKPRTRSAGCHKLKGYYSDGVTLRADTKLLLSTSISAYALA